MSPRSRTLILTERCMAGSVLAQLAPDDTTAIVEGRLFVGRQRIERADQPLTAGQQVTIYSERTVARPRPAQASLVLECREGIVAAAKPYDWSSEPDKTGNGTSLREQLRLELKSRELHIATRLDVGVSGLVLAAVDEASRRHLGRLMSAGNCHRRYVAIAAGRLPQRGTWQGSVVAAEVKAAPPIAVTHYVCLAVATLPRDSSLGYKTRFDSASLVSLRPETGHRHQLRIHCSRAGAPLLGDRRYGGPDRMTDADGRVTAIERILLHAARTTIALPSGKSWSPECPIPSEFSELWLRTGGRIEDLNSEEP